MDTTLQFRDAARVVGGVTASFEKRTLLWMAPRLPGWINSDHLTGLALAAMGLAGCSYWLAGSFPWELWLVNLCLAVNWFGDSLDGTLARVRQQQRPRYGFYVDHVVDSAGAMMLVGGMALSGYMSPLVAMGLAAAYFLLNIEVYLATYCLGTFRLSYFKLGPTELRLLLALGNAAVVLFHPDQTATFFGWNARLFDLGGLIAIVGLVVIFLVSAVRNTRTLYAAEPIPR
jgi:archaetidylinositol phosphate synthase